MVEVVEMLDENTDYNLVSKFTEVFEAWAELHRSAQNQGLAELMAHHSDDGKTCSGMCPEARQYLDRLGTVSAT